MKKAVFGCILLALAWPRAIGAQEVDEYQGEFMAGAEEPATTAVEGPRSIAEAKKEHRGYRIGAKGVHSAALPEGRDVHVVSDGDTLWDISSHYFGEPWHWPELWSYNPEITNPHWIYPLDQIRLTSGALTGDQAVAKLMGGQGGGAGGVQEGKASAGLLAGTETAPAVVVPRSAWKPDMIFLRDQGYLDKDALRTVGQIIGGNEEQMFLAPSDQVYIKFGPNQDVQPGDSYTVFRAMEGWERVEKEKGTLVRILGTAVVRSYDKDKHVARGLVSEALDPIERGLFVAKLDRRFDLVEPARNTSNVVAHIIATVQPHTLLADGSVVFLDVGEGHGIQPGNRFFVVRRGDEWLAALHAKPKDFGNVVDIPKYDPNLLPKEVVAELRVVKVRKSTTIAVITRSEVDAMIGDTAEMRVGF